MKTDKPAEGDPWPDSPRNLYLKFSIFGAELSSCGRSVL